MANPATSPPLTRASVFAAHDLIKPYIHRTPVLTNTTISTLASTPQNPEALKGTEWEGQTPAHPLAKLFFKCENFQRIGAFKTRGAFHAVRRLIEEQGLDEVRKRGVATHSSGNHAQALALAAKSFQIPAHIVMPSITPACKIAGTRSQGATLYFTGSTAAAREAAVADVVRKTGATIVPPYNHPDIILGQGTMALEFQTEVEHLVAGDAALGLGGGGGLDAVVAPCGGGGMLSGIAVALRGTGVKVFGAEPSFQGADDARRGVLAGERVTGVESLSIADGLRSELREWTWKIVSDKSYVEGLFAVSEQNIKDAMRLVLERMKVVIEPSAAVPLAVVLFNEEFRRLVEGSGRGWNIGVVFSGGNTTVDDISKLFAPVEEDIVQTVAG